MTLEEKENRLLWSLCRGILSLKQEICAMPNIILEKESYIGKNDILYKTITLNNKEKKLAKLNSRKMSIKIRPGGLHYPYLAILSTYT